MINIGYLFLFLSFLLLEKTFYGNDTFIGFEDFYVRRKNKIWSCNLNREKSYFHNKTINTSYKNRVLKESILLNLDLDVKKYKDDIITKKKTPENIYKDKNENNYEMKYDEGISNIIEEEKKDEKEVTENQEKDEKKEKEYNSDINKPVSLSHLKQYKNIYVNNNKKINKQKSIKKHLHPYNFENKSNKYLTFLLLDIRKESSTFMVPMKFYISQAISNISDEEYNKLMEDNSVDVYLNNALVEYKYENFEIKEGEAEVEGEVEGVEGKENNMNEEEKYNNDNDEKYNKENKDKENEINSNGHHENNEHQENDSGDSVIMKYTIIISGIVLLFAISFIIYYFDIIQKIKRKLNKQRKSNATMAIGRDKIQEEFM
ncbi:conserved Plasmodium protein, unknown function [Plasmodium sp. gorilla clade G2]|uniref:conserved Plasmodium protein, unknown function n=1 Tax=Plasmodium sp. gorilla clade G2 TaxID=880535 RepID=UPI000D223903|nr:conserved Plasmodium protein, unknown function [Plasmodium sp. gorilla clade G2]SOV11631.1 conserved Plasmodium protein, unknown function [Plasmodium sp. gorilla clade G2]